MTPSEFLKTDKATNFEDVAFTKKQWNAIYAWMNDFAEHQRSNKPSCASIIESSSIIKIKINEF